MKNLTEFSKMSEISFAPFDNYLVFADGDPSVNSLYFERGESGITHLKDGFTRFAFFAPNAKTVEVCGWGGTFPNKKIPLEKCDDGYFRTVVQLKRGFHYLDWFVDGVMTGNPIAPVGFGGFLNSNYADIITDENEPYLIKDVPHGQVALERYYSKITESEKLCYIYLPPSYSSSDKKYPVVYLQHGIGENECGWVWQGKVNFLLDNLIAEGKCRECIVVMNSGYALSSDQESGFLPGAFDMQLVNECMPFIERNYRVKRGRKNSAVAGLSLGGAQAFDIAKKHGEKFAYVGSFSGALFEENCSLSNKFDLIYVSKGTGENFSPVEKIRENLLKDGQNALLEVFEGYHEWHVFRDGFASFVQKLFVEEFEDENLPVKEIPVQGDVQESALRSYILDYSPVERTVDFAGGKPYKKLPLTAVQMDNGVLFRVKADGAHSVEVEIFGMKKTPLVNLGEYFEGVIENVEEGFHYYNLYINGTIVFDRRDNLGYGCSRAVNFIEVKEKNYSDYLLKSVPHGSVRAVYYKSEREGKFRLAYVYLPHGYGESDKRYPVLYLQHGAGENENGWIWQGKADNILDNLIAEGRCRECIVVMNTGYAFLNKPDEHRFLGSFDEVLVKECIPFIDRTFRTLPDKAHRAIAGLSMGSMQSERCAFKNSEYFSYVGLFSGTLNPELYPEFLRDKENFERNFKLCFLSCGKGDFFYERTLKALEETKSFGVPIKEYITEGYHDWTFWRHSLSEFLPLIFGFGS